jgi:hypothetical protein
MSRRNAQTEAAMDVINSAMAECARAEGQLPSAMEEGSSETTCRIGRWVVAKQTSRACGSGKNVIGPSSGICKLPIAQQTGAGPGPGPGHASQPHLGIAFHYATSTASKQRKNNKRCKGCL